MGHEHLHILIVDDSADSSEVTESQILAFMPSAACTRAPDGLEALKVLEAGPVDLVVTDEVMPKKSGTDLIKSARAIGITCPFIILTGLRAQDVVIDKRHMRGVYILEKPATTVDLQALAESAMRKRATP